ncbi:hypothetical protein CBS147332_4059 [Penicillium roqueforti]|nr:hypothetical protein CBS147332_4059 [Penicillium roqueforti]KAI3108920.1 hypothetical protein CBS147331_5712 [Penicillium roqueforti]
MSSIDSSPLVNSGSLRGFVKYMGILASSSEAQFASAVLGEITQQRERNHFQEEELKKLRKEILEINETKRTTIADMFIANENEKAKQRDSATQIESLRATIDAKEKNIAAFSKDLGASKQKIAKLELNLSQELTKGTKSADEINVLRESLKEKDRTIDQMRTAGSKLKSMLSAEEKKTKDLEGANTSMDTELQAVKAHIQRLEEFPIQPSAILEDFVVTKFTSLWTSAKSGLFPLLEQDVPEDTLKEKSIWEKLRKADRILLPPSFPLIPSNSLAAKAVRSALILAVLFREIDRRIFKPSYFLSGRNSLHEALSHLAENNGEKEAFCRRILLSIDPHAEYVALKAEIQAVVQTMSSFVEGLFPEAQHELFRTKTKSIVQDAAEFWLPIQRSQQKFEIDFEPSDLDDNEWDRFPLAGENTKPVAQDIHGFYLLNVFPCISLVEDGDHDPLTKVIQLRDSQELYLAAQNEATQVATSAITRRPRPRRQSTAGSNRRPFLAPGSSARISNLPHPLQPIFTGIPHYIVIPILQQNRVYLPRAVEFDDRILIFRVEVLPPKPWPKRIAGVPCYLTDNPNDKGPAIPFRYRTRSNIQISQDLDLRNKNDSLNLISDLVRQFFEQARISITEIQVWGHIVVIVLEDRIDHDENAMDKILRSVPRSVARCTFLYLSEHHMDRPRTLPAQRLQTASPSRSDGSQYDILRPGVMVSSGINLKGESMRSSSGVLVKNNLGQKFMTVAAHGFPADATVYHPHAGGRTIGRLIMELTHTDVALVNLEDGVEFVNEPFENTLTPATSFRLRDFIRIAETQQHDLVYFDSPFSGLAEGERMSRNTMRVPSDDPQEPQQIWVTTQWSYMGQDSAADMVDSVCSSAIWNDDHRVLGFFRYAPVEGLYKDYCLSVAADHLIDGGYSVV